MGLCSIICPLFPSIAPPSGIPSSLPQQDPHTGLTITRLASHLTEDEAKSYEFEPLLQAYRAANPKDPAPTDEFRQAIKELFPDACEAGSKAKAPTGESSDVEEQGNDKDNARNAWREYRYGQEIAQTFPRGSTPEDARRAYREREAEIEAMAATQFEPRDPSPVNLFEMSRAASNSPTKRCSAAKSSKTKRSGERAKAVNTEEQIPEPPSIFAEFAQVWKRASAFNSRSRPQRPQQPTLDVLNWALGK